MKQKTDKELVYIVYVDGSKYAKKRRDEARTELTSRNISKDTLQVLIDTCKRERQEDIKTRRTEDRKEIVSEARWGCFGFIAEIFYFFGRIIVGFFKAIFSVIKFFLELFD